MSASRRRLSLLAAYVVVNIVLIALTPRILAIYGFDWSVYQQAGQLAWQGQSPFATTIAPYNYSPLLAFAFPLFASFGLWAALHVAAAFAMPSWPMRLLTVATWGFWIDLSVGNVTVFVVLAAAWGLRGSRIGAITFLMLTLLVPRPLMLPVAVWLLWRDRSLWMPFAAMALGQAAVVLAVGWADDWARVLFAAPAVVGDKWNFGPSRLLGNWWLAAGIPLAIWLTRRGRVGFAALAVSPYLLPQYFLFGVLELRERAGDVRAPK